MGGNSGSTDLTIVQYAPINANGTVGTWVTTTAFTNTRNSHTTVAYNGYLYVIGGFNGLHRSDIEYANVGQVAV